MKLSVYSYNMWLFLVVSSYVFGIICIQWGYWPTLVNFSWFQMLLSVGAVYFTYEGDRAAWSKYFIIAFLTGYVIEVAGVNTGVIFGQYSYGTPLGVKVFNTPLMIGVNWFLVCYSVNQIVTKLLGVKWPTIFISASIITLIDYLIEPDAMRLGMWEWQGDRVPLKNYIAWWITSLFLSGVYLYYRPRFQRISFVIVTAMVVFFMAR